MKNSLASKLILFFCLFAFVVCEGQDIKPPTGLAIFANSKYGSINMTIKEFKTCKFSVRRLDKSISQDIELLAFTLKYTGKKSVIVKGNKLNERIILALGKLEIGDQVVICDAKTNLKSFCNMMSPLVITLRP